MRLLPRAAAIATLAFATVFTACESPDTSYRTSPSARTMLGGVTAGGVLYNIPEPPPEPKDAPDWDFELGNARFEKLQNGVPSLFVTGDYLTQEGMAMEIWLADEETTLAKWSGPTSSRFTGTVCWQQELEDDGVILPLEAGKEYTLTIAFRNRDDGGVVVAKRDLIRGNVPKLSGEPAQTGSDVFKHLLTCPKGS